MNGSNPPPKTLSLIVPALNEEGNIREACEAIARASRRHLSDYEILVFDDGSSDQTAEVARQLISENPRIQLFQNGFPRGIGFNYWAGILKACFPYTMLVPGDNEITEESLQEIFSQVGAADVLIAYSKNPEIRSPLRRLLSRFFTTTLNFFFGLQIKYYNGPNVVKTELAKQYGFSTNGFAYMATLLVRLLKMGHSYQQVGFTLRGRRSGKSKALSFKNFFEVLKDVATLFWKVRVRTLQSSKR